MNETPDRRKGDPLRDWLEKLESGEEHAFGIITEHGYRELEQKIQDHTDLVARRFRRWFIVSLTAFSVIALTSVVSLVGFGVLLGQQSAVTSDIQAQRKSSIGGACQDQNKRHDTTVNALNRALATAEKKAKTEKQKQKIRNSGQVSIGLIDALAPHQDCDRVVREATGQ